MSQVRPYIMDLGSTNGTYLNNERLDPERYYELLNKVPTLACCPCTKRARFATDCSMSLLCHANWHYAHYRYVSRIRLTTQHAECAIKDCIVT